MASLVPCTSVYLRPLSKRWDPPHSSRYRPSRTVTPVPAPRHGGGGGGGVD